MACSSMDCRSTPSEALHCVLGGGGRADIRDAKPSMRWMQAGCCRPSKTRSPQPRTVTTATTTSRVRPWATRPARRRREIEAPKTLQKSAEKSLGTSLAYDGFIMCLSEDRQRRSERDEGPSRKRWAALRLVASSAQGRPFMLGTALDHNTSLEWLAAYFLPGRAAKHVS